MALLDISDITISQLKTFTSNVFAPNIIESLKEVDCPLENTRQFIFGIYITSINSKLGIHHTTRRLTISLEHFSPGCSLYKSIYDKKWREYLISL